MNTKPKAAFEPDGITLPLTAIHNIREVVPKDNAFGKYDTVLATIREVGLVEPLVVFPLDESRKAFQLLDGHMRLKALRELGRTKAFCLVSTTNDAYTYNDKVNRIPLIQEHNMIREAVKRGAAPERIAKALNMDVTQIIQRLNLLNGIHPDAIELLKTKLISGNALRLFRKAKAVRQIDMAQLMVAANNYTKAYAEALIIGTPADQLVEKHRTKSKPGISDEDISKMEKEMESVERDYRLHEDQFGENSLHLNAAQRYVKRLLENTKIRRFFGNRYPEIFEELQELAVLEVI
jgi:ParB-like chromosome segregation protein Spo0J